MHKKSSAGTGTYSIIFGVAFVWFTTHFGGGFASGAQIYSYYVRFGIWCLIMPALAMLYNGIFFAYGMRFARKHEVYDYRSYNNAFYGKFAPVFSNLFEVLYICVMCVAPAVAFANTRGDVSSVTVTPKTANTVRGGTVNLQAVVNGGPGFFDRSVTWSLSGANSTGTVITAAGNLQVAADETATTITVTAASNADPSKTGNSTITISNNA